jgi:hypothetical protein
MNRKLKETAGETKLTKEDDTEEREVKKTRKKPTIQMYAELQEAFDFMNEYLFNKTLLDCVITLNATKVNTKGYFSEKAYVDEKGNPVHEVSLNPSWFGVQSIEDTISTLVHECAHLKRAQEREEEIKKELAEIAAGGKKKRKINKIAGGYHDLRWAEIMNGIGLKPISLDSPGKETGQKVHHEIVKGGLYENAAKRLIDKEFKITWKYKYATMGQTLIAGYEKRKREGNVEPEEEELIEVAPGVVIEEEEEKEKRKKTAGKREKYECPDCGILVWGKDGLNLLCLDCDRELVIVEKY